MAKSLLNRREFLSGRFGKRREEDRQLLSAKLRPVPCSLWCVTADVLTVTLNGKRLLSKRLSEVEQFLTRKMDGTTSLNDIVIETSRRFRQDSESVRQIGLDFVRLAGAKGVIRS